jgi:putative spermidine/putrescine transport system substrate-binding protein
MKSNGPSITRRHALAGLAAGAAGLVPCSSRADGQTLRVATYGGSWRDGLEKFIGAPLAAKGWHTEYVLGSPASNLARLIAARGRTAPFDGMEGAPDLVQGMAEAGLLQKIDYSQIPNSKTLPDFARSEYYIVDCALQDGIVYNAEKFKENGIEPPKHYSDLADPKLAGRVAFPDITHTSHYDTAVGLAYDAGGHEAKLDKAIPLIAKIKPAYYFTSSVELSTKFGSGEIWAAPWHAGYAVRLKRAGLPVAMAFQTIGDKYGALWLNLFHVVTGTAAPGAAYDFVNTYLDPDVQYGMTKHDGTIPMNPAARLRQGQDADTKGMLLTSDAELANMLQIDYSKIDMPAWHKAWTDFVQR